MNSLMSPVSSLTALIVAASVGSALAAPRRFSRTSIVQSAPAAASDSSEEFNRLRLEGNEAVYNLEYKTARQKFERMTMIAPEHPGGYVLLANNLWLETLNARRRLSASLYSAESFYAQTKTSEKADSKRTKEFDDLINKAISVSGTALKKNPKDAEALYYQGAALGLRAGFDATVLRSFSRAIGDANDSILLQRRVIKIDPGYTDAYTSIGLYKYIIDALPFGWRLLARFAGLKGSKKEGIEQLELVVAKGRLASDDARVLLIGICSREGQFDKALDNLGALAKKYPRNYLLSIERAAMLYRLGKRVEGAKAYGDLLNQEVVTRNAVDLVNYQWGESLFAAGDYAGALKRYEEVVRWPASNSDLVTLAYLHSGQAIDLSGDHGQASVQYEAVLKRENVFDSHERAEQFLKKAYGGK